MNDRRFDRKEAVKKFEYICKRSVLQISTDRFLQTAR